MNEKHIIEIINLIFEIEKKVKNNGYNKLNRNILRFKDLIENMGYCYSDPTGEEYRETRTDCQATIIGEKNPMLITDTIKPLIFSNDNQIIQQALVIVNG